MLTLKAKLNTINRNRETLSALGKEIQEQISIIVIIMTMAKT